MHIDSKNKFGGKFFRGGKSSVLMSLFETYDEFFSSHTFSLQKCSLNF